MKTIRLARTIRRQLPGGLLVWIGPEGIQVRQKRSIVLYSLSWKEVWERAQFLGVTHEMAVTDSYARKDAEQASLFCPECGTAKGAVEEGIRNLRAATQANIARRRTGDLE
jgi:hypothetical protein